MFLLGFFVFLTFFPGIWKSGTVGFLRLLPKEHPSKALGKERNREREREREKERERERERETERERERELFAYLGECLMSAHMCLAGAPLGHAHLEHLSDSP